MWKPKGKARSHWGLIQRRRGQEKGRGAKKLGSPMRGNECGRREVVTATKTLCWVDSIHPKTLNMVFCGNWASTGRSCSEDIKLL